MNILHLQRESSRNNFHKFLNVQLENLLHEIYNDKLNKKVLSK